MLRRATVCSNPLRRVLHQRLLTLRAEKRYTFILKDEILPPNPDNGREQATISYEADFELPPQTIPGEAHDRQVFIPWKSLNPTYRGKVSAPLW